MCLLSGSHHICGSEFFCCSYLLHTFEEIDEEVLVHQGRVISPTLHVYEMVNLELNANLYFSKGYASRHIIFHNGKKKREEREWGREGTEVQLLNSF